MRGFKTVGTLLALTAWMVVWVPNPGMAQGASDAQYLAAGNQMYQARNYTQALQYYNAAIKMNPNNAQAYQMAGYCYYAMGNKQYALAYLQRAQRLNPNDPRLAQAIQGLQGQTGNAAAAPSTPAGGSSYLTGGMTLFQRKQYAQAIQYFNAAIQQTPADYRPYYYAGYSYYMMGNAKNAAFYFAVANAKQPNASIKAYADRVKAGLSPDDQQWVDDQVAKYTGGTAYAAAGGAASKPSKTTFGFHLLGGMEYIFSDPSQIKQYVTAAQSVSLNGVTPNLVALPEFVPYVQLGDSFEINLAIGYFPVGNLSYTTYDYATVGPTGMPDVWKYTFNTTIVTTDLGVKLLFGDKDVKGYLGLGGGISPISVSFTKVQYDTTGTTVQQTDTLSSGTYGSMAFNAQAVLGVDFILGKGLALGPYIGYRYLSASNFQNNGATLVVDTKSGAVGLPGLNNVSATNNTPLQLDFSGLEAGLDLTFSF